MLLSSLLISWASASTLLQSLWAVELFELPAAELEEHLQETDPALRQRVALTLARLEDKASLPYLETLLEDPHPEVRIASLYALGRTPNGAELLKQHLERETDPEVRGEAWQALVPSFTARTDLPLLLAALDAQEYEAVGAAYALGRLTLSERERKQQPPWDGLLRLLEPQLFEEELIGHYALSSAYLPSRDVVQHRAAAFALGRLQPKSLTEEELSRLQAAAAREGDPLARRWLYRAMERVVLEEERVSFVSGLLRDPSPSIRVYAAQLVGSWDLPEQVPALLSDSEWAVRMAAIETAHLVKGLDLSATLLPLLRSEDPSEIAAALRGLAHTPEPPSPRVWLGESQPVMVQQAAISLVKDREQLFRLVEESVEPQVRSAAAERLMELGVRVTESKRLLASSDPVIATFGARLLALEPSPTSMKALVDRLDQESYPDLWRAGMKAIYRSLQVRVRGGQYGGMRGAVRRGLEHRDLAVREAAVAPARAMGLRIPDGPGQDAAQGLPPLDEVLAIQSARILTDAGEVRVELYPELAPMTVWSFAQLAQDGFYDGTSFHSVEPARMIQGGCPRGDGWGSPGYSLPDEVSWMPFKKGTLAALRADPDTAGSQWFITLDDQPHLRDLYTVFGQVSLNNGVPQSIHPGAKILEVIIESQSAQPMGFGPTAAEYAR